MLKLVVLTWNAMSKFEVISGGQSKAYSTLIKTWWHLGCFPTALQNCTYIVLHDK